MKIFYKILETEPLFESVDYKSLFNDAYKTYAAFPERLGIDVVNIPENKLYYLELKKVLDTEISAIIANAKHYLKKSNIIVWCLKQWKYGGLIDTIKAEVGIMSVTFKVLIFKAFIQEYTKDVNKTTLIKAKEFDVYNDLMNIRGWVWRNNLEQMGHYLSLPVSQIRNYNNYTFESVDSVLTLFAEYEKEWKETVQSRIPYDLTNIKEIILEMGDWQWVDLGRGACSEEAKAMGHCGNVPSEKSGDTILSLRKLQKEGNHTFWSPHLTFILHAHGVLGEMKGRGNDKPAKKYHPYILELLKLPIITKVAGGGYQPEHNFKLSDLTAIQLKELHTINPGIFENLTGMDRVVILDVGDPEAITKVKNDVLREYITDFYDIGKEISRLKDNPISPDPSYIAVVRITNIPKFVEKFLSKYDKDNYEAAEQTKENSFIYGDHGYSHVSTHDLSFIDNTYYTKLLEIAKKEFEEEELEDLFEYSDPTLEELVSFLFENFDSFEQLCRRSVSAAMESYALNEAETWLEKLYSEISGSIINCYGPVEVLSDKLICRFYDSEHNELLQSKIYDPEYAILFLNKDEFMENINDKENFEELLEYLEYPHAYGTVEFEISDLKMPNLDMNGYEDEVAAEYFADHFEEIEDEIDQNI